MKTSIVIPTFQHCEDLLTPCIESIIKYTTMTDVELIVVANGCTDGTITYLMNLIGKLGSQHIRIIWKDQPIGYTCATNMGIEASKGEYVVLLNNDNILLEQEKNKWLDTLLEPLQNPKVAITGPLESHSEAANSRFLIFCCVAMRRSLFTEIGKLDETFNPGFGEDVDLCVKAIKAGYEIVQIGGPSKLDGTLNVSWYPLYHKAEATMHDPNSKIKEIFGLDWPEIIKRNNDVLRKRYNTINYIELLKDKDRQLYESIVLANEYRISEEEIKDRVIVDVGANIGFFSAVCLQHSPKKIYAIEPVPSTFRKLQELYKNDNRMILFNNAVLNTSGETVYFSENTTGARIIDTKNEHESTTITLKEILENEPSNDMILKVDCEGSEFPILLNIERDLLRRFEYIHVETHEFAGEKRDEKHTSEYLINHIKSFGYLMKDAPARYWGWIEWPDGTRTDSRELGVNVCKFTRIPSPKYSIIIPTFQRCNDLLRPCLESIQKHTDLKDMEVIVVANGCTDNTKEYVESLGSPFKLIWIDEQLGFTKSTNIGIKAAQGEYIILLNNDTVLLNQRTNEWLDMMRKPFEEDEKMGMTGPMLFKGNKGTSNDFVMFFCCMTTKKIIDEIGLLDEEFSPGGVEDVDYGLRLDIAGYKLKQVPTSERTNSSILSVSTFPIYHPGGSSVRTSYPNWQNILVRNNDYLKKKFPDHFYGVDWIEEEKIRLNKPKIYDCFPFFNEFELLEIRLHELYDIVEKFIITEAETTHSGLPKPLYLKDNLARFAKYKDKIVVRTIKLPDPEKEPVNAVEAHDAVWAREQKQRNAAMETLKDIASDDDYIIISDADEIPRISAIREYVNKNTNHIGVLVQDRFMYYLNYKNITTNEPQLNSKIVRFKVLKTTNPCGIRYCDKYKGDLPDYCNIANGGWHFTFMGGAEKVRTKIQAFAHQEYNSPDKLSQVEKLIEDGKDVYSCDSTWRYVDIDGSFPSLITNNQEKYKEWIKNKHKIYDCFMFFNELDILEIRLNELYNVVDRFVIVEAKKTHSGASKPLYFNDNLPRFEKFLNKITYSVIEDFPAQPDQWKQHHEREVIQRNHIMKVIKECNDNDMIIISDCDEIPRANIIKSYPHIMALDQIIYYYDFNTINPEKWTKAKILPFKELRDKFNGEPQQLRNLECETISNAGWHLSYFYDADGISNKLKSFFHQEYKDLPKDTILSAMKEQKDLFGRWNFKITDAKDLPEYVSNHIEKYKEKGFIRKDTMKNMNVTATISTKDRYDFLSIAILSIANQTLTPKELIVYDDGEQKDLRENPLYHNLFRLLDHKGIAWSIRFGKRIGQADNHQRAISESKYDLIWRVDDDDAPEPDVLEKLVSHMGPNVGAIGGLVLTPTTDNLPNSSASSKIEDIYDCINLQWFKNSSKGLIEVDHLNNTFLFRKEAASHGYPKNLSPVCHREETIFSYGIKRAGWKVLVDTTAVTWHLKGTVGGIRSYNHPEWYAQDDKVFANLLKEWGVKTSQKQFIVLNNGLGDHIIFKTILTKIKEMFSNKTLIIAACYPDVFSEDNIKIISIAEAMQLGVKMEEYDVYKFCCETNWQQDLATAFLEMYERKI